MSNSFPFVPDHRLYNPKYREELLSKLEALISVLEMAHQKVVRNIEMPGADLTRLARVRNNLEGTLEVCRRARRLLVEGDFSKNEQSQGLQKSLLPLAPQRSTDGDQDTMDYREYTEITNFDEYKRLRKLGPIQWDEVVDVDINSLCNRLTGQD